MAEGERIRIQPGALWGTILRSARERATTAQIWESIRAQYPADQFQLPADPLGTVNRLRSIATGLAESSRRLGRAGDDQAITGRMIGQQVYARDTAARATTPSYHVRFQLPVTTPEGTRTDWYTMEYNGPLPATVGDLRADLGLYSESLGEDYGVSIGEVGAIEIGAY